MISIYFANNYTNNFEKLSDTNKHNITEYHSDWMCDVCFAQPYNIELFQYKTIISTETHYKRLCSSCINTKNFHSIFLNNSDRILSIIHTHLNLQ